MKLFLTYNKEEKFYTLYKIDYTGHHTMVELFKSMDKADQYVDTFFRLPKSTVKEYEV